MGSLLMSMTVTQNLTNVTNPVGLFGGHHPVVVLYLISYVQIPS